MVLWLAPILHENRSSGGSGYYNPAAEQKRLQEAKEREEYVARRDKLLADEKALRRSHPTSYAQKSKYQSSFFRPSHVDVASAILLQHTAKSEEKEAHVIAKENPALILQKSSFTEEQCGQRRWYSVSPLQYAAWAGDKKIMHMYLELISDNDKAEALKQLSEVQSKGTEYGEHLSPVHRLVNSYKAFEALRFWEKEAIELTWLYEIGKNQLNSVVNFMREIYGNVVSEYAMLSMTTSNLDLSITSPIGEQYTLFKYSNDKTIKMHFLDYNIRTSSSMVPCVPQFKEEYNPLKDRDHMALYCEDRARDLASAINTLKDEVRQVNENNSENYNSNDRMCLIM